MSTDGKVKIENLRNNRGTYTREQKLVAAVWFHERKYTGMSYTQLCINFQKRFKTKSPTTDIMGKWDRKLFKDGYFFRGEPAARPSTYLPRLVYVPYVKESFLRYPDLLDTNRANMLGISLKSLKSILKQDVSPQEVKQWKQQGREKAATGGSSNTTSSIDVKDSSKEDNCKENIQIGEVGVDEDFTVKFNSDKDNGNLESQLVQEEIIIKSECD